ncbi:hypothetical protein ABBQ38_000380 [Trebouxia sp. C0009 RCD-2024]
MDLTATPSYRQQPGQLAVELLYSDLPGALALLQEAGELKTVLDWGGAWLRDNATDSKTKDVALALALAHCDNAAMQMEQNANDTMTAAEEMTVALRLLRQHAAGEQLQQEIIGALQELEPKVALQQISLPVENVKRAAGLAQLSHLVWTSDSKTLGMERADYMRAVRDNLTAAEQIVLFEGAGEGVRLSSEDQYDTALAYLAEGYCSRRPQHVRTAHKLLAPLHNRMQTGAGPQDIVVSVELAVCCLLLGDSEKAEDVLGLAPGSTAQQADPSVKSFVLVPSSAHAGFVSKWLGEVALPGFRGAPPQRGTLADWFEDRRVSLYLQVLDNGRRLHLGDAAVATRSALSRFSSSVSAAFMAPLSALHNALGAPPATPSSTTPKSATPVTAAPVSAPPASTPPTAATSSSTTHSSANASSAYATVDSSDAQSLSPRRDSHSVEAAPPQTAADPIEARVKVSVRAPSHSNADATPMEARLADALVSGTSLATKQQPNPASNDLLDEDMGPLRRAPLSRAGHSRASLQGPMGITEGIVEFAGEREMWASFQDANLRKQKQLKALLAGAALLVAALLFRTFQQHKGRMPVTATPPQAVAHVAHQEDNRHWEYDLHKLDILSVDVAEDGQSAVILAALQEDASLYEDAELVHVYKGTFTSEYTATRQTHGWKLTHNNVTF